MTPVTLERLNPRQFERFRDFLYQRSGISVDDRKVALLSNRIRRRLRAGPFANFDDYYQFLTSPRGAGELEHFLDAVTTNETSFFRTPDHFEWLRNEFLPEAATACRRGSRESPPRLWSAGCANGAETYSMAICVAENAFRFRDAKPTVLGTDISSEQIRDAVRGVYQERQLESVSDARRRRFFHYDRTEGVWEVRSTLREDVEFRTHNLMQPSPESPFDCVFIRNVLIYFDSDSKAVVVGHLLDVLAPGGYLVVGPSEGVHGLMQALTRHSNFLYQKT